METIPPMISIRWKEKLPACISKDGKVPARIPPTVTLIFIKDFEGEKNSRQNTSYCYFDFYKGF